METTQPLPPFKSLFPFRSFLVSTFVFPRLHLSLLSWDFLSFSFFFYDTVNYTPVWIHFPTDAKIFRYKFLSFTMEFCSLYFLFLFLFYDTLHFCISLSFTISIPVHIWCRILEHDKSLLSSRFPYITLSYLCQKYLLGSNCTGIKRKRNNRTELGREIINNYERIALDFHKSIWLRQLKHARMRVCGVSLIQCQSPLLILSEYYQGM